VFSLDGKMLDIAFLPGAERVLSLAKASGKYGGDLV
ncbi:MAG: citrate lyase subunit beta, partial [Defluviitaleaceae bacterium]|nr:citrate lyase subunit beta [Defluviitaleaceae bacterium]